MKTPHVSVIARLAAQQLSVQEAASALGHSEARTLDLLEVYELSRAAAAIEQAHGRRRLLRSALSLAIATAVGLVWWVGPAYAQSCSQVLPTPMVTFCPDDAALASDVNTNFQQLHTWVAQKLGPMGNANITTDGSLTFSGLGRQVVTLQSPEYGYGLQNATSYARTGGGFAWFKGGDHSNVANDPGMNGTVLMTLSGTGVLGVGYHVNVCPSAQECECTAPAKPLGGGVDCNVTAQSVYWSRPNAAGTGWSGLCFSNSVATPASVTVICARFGL